MDSKFAKYKSDLDALVSQGGTLQIAIQHESFPEQTIEAFEKLFKEQSKDRSAEEIKKTASEVIKNLPSFLTTYQTWYSEAKALIKQLLPDRLDDFVRHYEKPKPRKDITFENYRIEDYLQGLRITRAHEVIVDKSAAIPHFQQQLAILDAVKKRFESSLFDIKQLVQADVFDSELDAAQELAKNGYLRAAGAMCGVVLERHLGQVASNHSVDITKKNASIGDYNNALKEAGVVDTPQWRSIQLLADIRNICDHKKAADPTPDQINDLIQGVSKLIKTLF